MTLRHGIRTAIRGLSVHASRSALTILGIVIGIAAIILVMSLGKGAENLILGQIQGLGSKTIVVLPGRQPSGLSDVAQIFSDSLKEKDLDALSRKENVPYLTEILPIAFGPESASYRNESYRLTVLGVAPQVAGIFDLAAEEGQFLADEDVLSRASVAVIGSKVKEELFANAPALGEKIKIGGRSFRIIGLLPKKGQVSFFNFDEMALIPYTTAQEYVFGKRYFDRFIIQAESEELIAATVEDITRTLRASHGITDTTKDDFHTETTEDIAERLGVITSVLTLFLAAVTAISLIVGGIGIMNIMLVSVTERTKEIGLRKALGATQKDILAQFLLEAVILTTIGGIIGIALGTLLAIIASFILGSVIGIGWTFTFPVFAAFLGLVVSGGVGLLFGIYPARKASLKDPIEALRYE